MMEVGTLKMSYISEDKTETYMAVFMLFKSIFSHPYNINSKLILYV